MRVAVASGKGGTGKTTVSVNLAAYIAEREPVFLVDLDVEAPDTSRFIHMDNGEIRETYRQVPVWDADACSRCGKCIEICRFNALASVRDDIIVFPGLCHGCHACSVLCESVALRMKSVPMGSIRYITRGNLHLVEGITNIGEEQSVPQIRETVDFAVKKNSNLPVGRQSSITVYDAPPGTACPAVEVMHAADSVILVTEPTPFGYHDLNLAIAAAAELGHKPMVVINRSDLGDTRIDDLCNAHDIPIIARIPYSRHIAELYAEGALLLDKSKTIRKAMSDIAKAVFSLSGSGSADKAGAV